MLPDAFLAGLPILVILGVMLGWRWSAARAGALGLLITVFVAWFSFGYGSRLFPELGPAVATLAALGEAGFIALTILWIIFPALCIYELQRTTGATEHLRAAVGGLSGDPRVAALLIAWFFALFMEGAAGFGTSAALAAPFLVSMGFAPVQAVCLALVGHAVGVSFGAVGTPIVPQLAVTPFSAVELSGATAIYHGLLGWIMASLLMILILIQRALPRDALALSGARRAELQPWLWTLLAAFVFLLPYYLIAAFVGPELPTLGGSLIGVCVFIALLLFARRRNRYKSNHAPRQSVQLLRAAAPYLTLVVLVLLTRLVVPIREFLGSVGLGWEYAAFKGDMAPLYHPGSLLLVSFFLGAAWQRADGKAVRAAMQKASRRLVPVTLALIAMLGLSRIMVHAGMINSLAVAAAASLGASWPLLAPFVGALGTFVTGSATASNILFSEFQQATAERLGFSPLALLGAQGFGAAVGNIVCPHNIIAANAVVNLSAKEGEVLRRTAGIMLLYTFCGGLLALWFA
ncbi:MAG: L-lactate permease [Cellvibrionaceae bacterium]